MQEAVRLYLRELRDKQGITQQDAADTIGLSLRAFSDWETGKSSDIKFRFLVRLVRLLNASWEHMSNLELNIPESTPVVTKQYPPTKLELDEDLLSLIEHLRTDKTLAIAFIAFWSGWKAKELA